MPEPTATREAAAAESPTPLGCPFCGRAPEINEPSPIGPTSNVYVSCNHFRQCRATPFVVGAGQHEAIARWNKRARPAPDRAALIDAAAAAMYRSMCGSEEVWHELVGEMPAAADRYRAIIAPAVDAVLRALGYADATDADAPAAREEG